VAAVADHDEAPVPGGWQVHREAHPAESLVRISGGDGPLDAAVLGHGARRRAPERGAHRRPNLLGKGGIAAAGAVLACGLVGDRQAVQRGEAAAGLGPGGSVDGERKARQDDGGGNAHGSSPPRDVAGNDIARLSY
jgi:hypothetical protein